MLQLPVPPTSHKVVVFIKFLYIEETKEEQIENRRLKLLISDWWNPRWCQCWLRALRLLEKFLHCPQCGRSSHPLALSAWALRQGYQVWDPFVEMSSVESWYPFSYSTKWNRLILQCTDQQRSWMVTQVFWSTAGPTLENPPLTLEHSVRVSVGGGSPEVGITPFEKNRCHSCHFKLTLAEKDQQKHSAGWTIFDWYSVKYCMGLWSTNSPICCCCLSSWMHNGVITIFCSDFPPSDQSLWMWNVPTEKGNPDRVGARASLSSSLGGTGEGGGLPEGVRALTQEGAHPGDKGGRWRIRSKEPD